MSAERASVQALHLSESEAYLRIGAARLGRRFPRVLRMLASGELHPSALKLLAPVLDDANCDALLDAARCKSKREVELLLAQRRALPDVPGVIRKLPQLSPLGEDRYKVQLTAGKPLHDNIRQAQALMRHELPNGDVAQVLERALDLLIADRMKKRFAQTSKPRTAPPRTARKADSRYIPSEVRGQVLERDGARCSYVSPDGKRCEQRGWLELHHEDPFARGGQATPDNIRIMCAPHNRLLAERDFGRAFVRQRIELSRGRPRSEVRNEHPD